MRAQRCTTVCSKYLEVFGCCFHLASTIAVGPTLGHVTSPSMSYHILSDFFNMLVPLGENNSKKEKKVIFEEGGAHLILDEKGM